MDRWQIRQFRECVNKLMLSLRKLDKYFSEVLRHFKIKLYFLTLHSNKLKIYRFASYYILFNDIHPCSINLRSATELIH